MKLLLDMNLSPRWVQVLTRAGFEAMHWSAIGEPNAADSKIMAFAAANGCVVITHDLDFSAFLAATRGRRPSLVQLRTRDLSPDVLGKRVVFALWLVAAEMAAGAVITIEPSRMRLRFLPFDA